MNSLSWFLYLADVVSHVGSMFGLAAGACILFCAVAGVLQVLSEGEMSKDCPNVWKYWWRCAVAAFFFGMMAALFPSKSTMYAIAASQAGEQIAKNEAIQGIASDATRALQQWIKKQIEPDAKR